MTLELLDAPGTRVLALGGGAVGSAAVRAALAEHLVVWVDVDREAAWLRCKGTGRPLASDRAAFERLHAEREPLYAAAARRSWSATRDRIGWPRCSAPLRASRPER